MKGQKKWGKGILAMYLNILRSNNLEQIKLGYSNLQEQVRNINF